MENIFQTVNDIQQSPLWGLAWKLLWFSIAIIWVSLILWTLKDARKRIDDGLIIGVAVATSLVFPFIGTLVYTGTYERKNQRGGHSHSNNEPIVYALPGIFQGPENQRHPVSYTHLTLPTIYS